MRKQLTTQGSNEVTEPNFINDIDYANKLGARPKRLVTKPKRFEDFHSFTGKFETLFMAANMVQRKSIQAALALHLEICTQHCHSHDIFKY